MWSNIRRWPSVYQGAEAQACSGREGGMDAEVSGSEHGGSASPYRGKEMVGRRITEGVVKRQSG